MEERSVSLSNSVPSFARGSDILLVHSDTLSLGYLASLLRQCSFKVTATNQASAAIDMVWQQEGGFKLVMAKADMPDMSTLSFLNTLLLKDIPVIFISSGQNDGVARAALDKGLCYLLEEPIQPEDLLYVWQQVYYPNKNLAREIQNAKCQEKVQEASENQNKSYDDVKGEQKGKRSKLSLHLMNLYNNHHNAEEEEKEIREHNNDGSSAKRPRISWTPDLHHKFVQAISVLGENNIRPKEIQQIMNVPNLTCRHIASHLQKFKSQIRRLWHLCTKDLHPASKSSNFSSKTKLSSSFESQSYPGCPTSAAFQNENQNQSHFPMNSVETQGPNIFLLQETSGNADISFQHPTELVNYGNQDLYAVIEGAVPDALMDKNQYIAKCNNIPKFLGEDSDKYDCFGNGLSPDDTAQNSEVLKNSIFGNNASSQQSGSCNTSCVSLLKAKYDCFGNGSSPDDTAQNSEVLKNSIFRNSASSQQSGSCNTSCVSLLKPKPSAAVGGLESVALTDQNQTLTKYNSNLRFLGKDCQGYDHFGKGLYVFSQNSKILRSSISGNSFSSQLSHNSNSSYVNLLKAKPSTTTVEPESDALMDQSQTQIKYNNSLRTPGEKCKGYDYFGKRPYDISWNSEMLRNSILGNSSIPQQFDNCNPSSVRLLKAKPCAGVGATVPNALMDYDKTLAAYNNIIRIFGSDSEKYDYFGNEPTPHDISMPRNSKFGDNSNPQLSENCNTSHV